MTQPFASNVDFNSGILEDYDNKVVRKLSDMQGMFADSDKYQKFLENEDSIVYEVFEKSVPEKEGELAHAVTVIYPGKVGDEFYMTKGHFHVVEDTAELYLCIKGSGGIAMETKEGDFKYIEMKPGSLVYVAPYWAHRTVNTGNEEFSFLAIYPANAGHDYGSIEEKGFKKLVVDQNGQPELVDNPRSQ